MGRKSLEVNPECGKRLESWLKHVGLTAKTLGAAINYTPQYLSDVVRGKKRLTPELAERIANLPDSYVDSDTGETVCLNISVLDKVLKEFLLLETEMMTMADICESNSKNKSGREELIIELLKLHGYVIEDKTDCMPILQDKNGREYQKTMFAIASTWSKSERYLSHKELTEFINKIDDSIEMQCMFLFERILRHDIGSRRANNG